MCLLAIRAAVAPVAPFMVMAFVVRTTMELQLAHLTRPTGPHMGELVLVFVAPRLVHQFPQSPSTTTYMALSASSPTQIVTHTFLVITVQAMRPVALPVAVRL